MKILNWFFGDLKSSDSILKIVSIVYSIAIATAWINYYDDKLCWYLIPVTLLFISLFYKIFDYTIKHRIYGFFLSVAVFGMLFTIIIGGFVPMGEMDYDLSFGAWFLTPQGAIDDTSREYTLAMYGIILIFTSGITYYFTRIRYRIFMNFLIIIIPFMNFAKEEKLMTLALSIPIVLLFVLVYILYSDIKYPTKKKPAYNYKMKKPVIVVANLTVMLFFMTIVALLIPKPNYEARRESLESVLDLASLSDYLEASFDRFTNVSNGAVMFRRNNENPPPLFFVTASEPLNLKAQTFDKYSFSANEWSKSDNDHYNKFYKNWSSDLVDMNPGTFAEAVYAACQADGEFAEKYGFEFESEPASSGESIVRVRHNDFSTAFMLNPTRTIDINLNEDKTFEEDDSVWRWKSGELRFKAINTSANENYKIDYYSESIDSGIMSVLEELTYDEYRVFLSELKTALWNDISEYYTYIDLVELYVDDLWYTEEYFAPNVSDIPNSVKKLAGEITAGLDSDYEKALAIERYFIENDFKYDLNFRPKAGSNAEDFLLDSKTGVCFEFATAMTVLCRASGIPARYVEGYKASEEFQFSNTGANNQEDDGANTYIVNSNSAHAFPEVFISGYGWMSFEPTVPSDESPVSSFLAGIASSGTMTAGIFLLIISILLGILIAIFGPIIAHKWFLRRVYRSDKPLSLVLLKLRKLSGLGNSSTGTEILQASGGTQYSAICDRVIYGDYKLSMNEKKEFLNFYIDYFKKEREKKKFKFKKSKTKK